MVLIFTHVALLRDGVFMLEGVVGELRGVVRRRVSVIRGSVEGNCTVTWRETIQLQALKRRQCENCLNYHVILC